jgi:hypothetical protein
LVFGKDTNPKAYYLSAEFLVPRAAQQHDRVTNEREYMEAFKKAVGIDGRSSSSRSRNQLGQRAWAAWAQCFLDSCRR